MKVDFSDYFSFDDIVLRPIEEKDIANLTPIINEAYSYQDKAKGQPRTDIEHLTKRVSEVDFYVLISTNRIVGCVYLEPKETILHFGLLTLISELRGKGVGSAIMNAINEYARDKKFKTIALDYMSLAPWLKKYYEKYGYSETGEVIEWGTIDLVRMNKDVAI